MDIDGIEVNKDGIEDYLEDIAGAMLDGEESGSVQITVDIDLSLVISAQSGRLAMGEVVLESLDILDLYETCNFATDGNDVIFDAELDLPDTVMKAIKESIIEMAGES